MKGRNRSRASRQWGRGVMPVLVTLGALGLLGAVAFLMLGGDPQSWLREEFRQEAASAPVAEAPVVSGTREPDPEALMTLKPSSRRVLVNEGGGTPGVDGVPGATLGEADPALPRLNDSDAPVREALVSLAPSTALADWLITDELVRKFVVSVDNMARGDFPHKHSLLKPMGSSFRAVERQERFWLDGYNYSRYTPYIELFTVLDVDQLRDLYVRYYPLMQEAYAELGYPRESFHRRMLETLDHLLDSPIQEGVVELAQTSSGISQYADPSLEALSDVHKQMLRLGPANARKVMERLTLLRTELAQLEHP